MIMKLMLVISIFCMYSIELNKEIGTDASPIASTQGPKTSFGYSTGFCNKSISINQLLQMGRERIPLLIVSVSSFKNELKRMLSLDQSNTFQLRFDDFILVPLVCTRTQITERLKLQNIYIKKFVRSLKIMQNDFTSGPPKELLDKVRANLNELSLTFSYILERLDVPRIKTTPYIPSMAYLDGITREYVRRNLGIIGEYSSSMNNYRDLALINTLSSFLLTAKKEYNSMFMDPTEIDI